jgi:propionate CoA-transferase
MKTIDVLTAQEAAALVRDGDTLLICGCENVLLPNTLLRALGERYETTGSPRNITEIHPIIVGMGEGMGLENLAHRGLVKRAIGSGYSYLKTSRYTELLKGNAFEAHVLPMGTLFQIIRDTAAGKKFTLTSVGLETFVDPDRDGGKLNASAKTSLASRIQIGSETYLKYDAIPAQIAFLRGTTADEYGNISLEGEPVSLGVRTMAMAVKNSGGKVIVQVQRMARDKFLPPRLVEIPGIFVDAIVVDAEQPPSGGTLNPALTGEIRLSQTSMQPLSAGIDRIVASRAAAEITIHDIVNIGVGMPIGVPRIVAERGMAGEVTFFPEHGSVGGIPADRAVFGANINPDAIIDSTNVFDFFCGGGLNISFLGIGQIDKFGNVNVSKFNGIVPGCGGFIDITHKTRRIVFCGSFSAGGLDVEFVDGNLNIKTEGRNSKFVKDVEQVTFNGQQGVLKGQKVIYVTERAVFSLHADGLVLEEHAPGVDIRKHILDLIPFEVAVSSTLKPMDKCHFT